MGFDLQAHQELKRLNYTVNCLVRDFCCKVKRCIGISNTGDPNLVLNQRGEWIPLRNISQYAALVSKIDFTNNGGDNYSVDFFIDPISSQLPTGVTIVDYDYRTTIWVGGNLTDLDNGTETSDYTFNSVGNGAGVYELKCKYSLSNGEHLFIQGLIKVDGSGNILQSIFVNGLTVNSISGLNINVTLENTQTNYTGDIIFLAFDGSSTRALLNNGNNDTATVTTQVGDIWVLGTVDLDSTWNDFAGDFITNSITVIL